MYEIPKIRVPIILHLVNDEAIAGKMFVTEDLVSPGGNPEVEDYLNEDPDFFFSFESDAGAYRLISKHQVVYIETEQDDTEAREQTPLEPRPLVVHFTNRATIYGVVFPILAEESRVSDILNQDDPFITLYRQGKKIVLNRGQVIYVNAN
ncbi:MAG: hypothetical protein WD002_09175 [Pseudomonadales bacterium]